MSLQGRGWSRIEELPVYVLVITAQDSAGHIVEDAVMRAVRASGAIPRPLSDVSPGAAVSTSRVTDAIRQADLVIVDITRLEPNAMYELGFAHALDRPSLLLIDVDVHSNLPSDLAGTRPPIFYDRTNLRRLEREVSFAVKRDIKRLSRGGERLG